MGVVLFVVFGIGGVGYVSCFVVLVVLGCV